MKFNEIIRIHGTDYKNMTKVLLKRAQLAESIMAKTGCIPHPLIGIKPNLVSPTPAEFGATTHPEIAAGIIEYLKENRFDNIIICEGSWVGDKTSDAFEYCGYNSLADKYGVRLFDTQTDSSYKVHFKNMDLNICSCVKKINYLINVPVLKGHCQTKITCALKNMKGLIPNSEKRRFHSLGLHTPIAYLNKCIRQDFIVVDSICGDPYFEEGGNPLVKNNILASKNPLLTDIFACRELNITPEEVPYINMARELGIGKVNSTSISLIDLNGSDQNDGLPASAEIPADNGRNMITQPLELNYATNEIESCSACYSSLTDALSELNKKDLLHKLINEMHFSFCIGQGYKESTCEDDHKIGIGSCTKHFVRYIPGCPPSSESILEYLMKIQSCAEQD